MYRTCVSMILYTLHAQSEVLAGWSCSALLVRSHILARIKRIITQREQSALVPRVGARARVSRAARDAVRCDREVGCLPVGGEGCEAGGGRGYFNIFYNFYSLGM